MHSLEPEIRTLRPLLGDAAADALIARERREVFSIDPELRIAAWAGALLLATAAGILLKDNLDRIGPLALALLIGAAAAVCYAWAWWHRAREGMVDDYVLLLGALLISADVAFIETQFELLGGAWPRHFLLLAIIHGIAAYLFGSRLVLTLSVVAFAAWLGIEQRMLGAGIIENDFEPIDFALRAFVCAAALVVWRVTDRAARPASDFGPVFEHFAANIALAGAIALTFEDDTRVAGCVVALALATFVIVWGFRTQRESFVLYAFVYGVIAADVLLFELLDMQSTTAGLLLIVVSMIVAVATLIAIHARFRELRA